eukprot:TRINITY_DN8620_c0_g2_i1.p1 TRINITY_DN8620_c0_g2~~TRINITY_DN8620_c0_g2_i1.p1  ORF type:complete len:382 (+),score=46.24 TRINITY_DN8620_c0_g2_i1:116-1147(+)
MVASTRCDENHDVSLPSSKKPVARSASLESVQTLDLDVSGSTRCNSPVGSLEADVGSEHALASSLNVGHISNAERLDHPYTGSCLSSLASLDRWLQPEETLVFLDFDDTIFPTTWLQEVLPSASRNALPSVDDIRRCGADAVASLTRHESVVIAFLRTVAAFAGEVVIVTLATPEWLDSCMRNVMPKALDEISKLNIQISYAREALSRQRLRGALSEGKDIFPLMKRVAMKKAIKQFYSQRPKQSWKNCISIGDSVVEREALEEITFRRFQCSKSGIQKMVRCKTLKFLSSPSLDDLTSEIEMLISFVSALTHYDGDFSYDINSNDDMEFIMLHECLSERVRG